MMSIVIHRSSRRFGRDSVLNTPSLTSFASEIAQRTRFGDVIVDEIVCYPLRASMVSDVTSADAAGRSVGWHWTLRGDVSLH